MEIKFENYTRHESIPADCTESIKINFDVDGDLFFTIENNYFGAAESKHTFYSISKEQLSDFIGALLHVQQKLNRRK